MFSHRYLDVFCCRMCSHGVCCGENLTAGYSSKWWPALRSCHHLFWFFILFRPSKLSYVSVAIQLAMAWRPIRSTISILYLAIIFNLSTTCCCSIFLQNDSLTSDSRRCGCYILGISIWTKTKLMCSFHSYNKIPGNTQIMKIIGDNRC